MQVVGGAPADGEGDNLRNIVTVETFDFSFEGGKLFFDGFDEEQLLARGLDFSLPAVDRLNRAKDDRDTGGEMLVYDFAGDAARFDEIAAGDQNDARAFGASHKLLRGLVRLGKRFGKRLSLRRA